MLTLLAVSTQDSLAENLFLYENRPFLYENRPTFESRFSSISSAAIGDFGRFFLGERSAKRSVEPQIWAERGTDDS